MQFGVRSIVAEKKSLKSSFLTESSEIIAKAPEFNVLKHTLFICEKKSTYFEICQKLCFSCFFPNMKNGLKYFFALTLSIESIIFRKD